ncbi:uncharacterized protein LOC141657256 [Silene latifolia]|uniref:uncharacterized protein LOC141657256 n=1 Tax=Silene latifolia TaxID=37657 RepID=UPI003D7767BF
MAIRTFTTQERYSRNKEGVEEPRKKLKKLKSVKVANLDRLRLSMRKEKSRFDRSSVASSNDATNPSGASSTPMSGTSSPNYMKATSSSARKGSSSQGNLGTVLYSSASSNDARDSVRKSKFQTPTVKFNREVVRTQKSLKRVPSVKYVKKLSSLKSLKIRAKYSQFQENSSIDEYIISDSNDVCDQESIVSGGDNQTSVVDRSRTIKLTRLRSKRYPRVPKSRLYGAEEKLSYGEPHYMKGTNSHEVKKNSVKGLTRTSSWRPLKILAKVPSFRPRKSKVRKRPQEIPLSRTGLDRATCSSTLKRSEFPDHIELHSGERESHGTSSIHVCPYNYCSLNGHHHHAPSLPLKEFISAKRQSIKNQKDKQLNEDVEQTISSLKNYQSRQMISAEVHSAKMVTPTIQEEEEEDDDGFDYLITIYAKPRKKWAVEGNPGSDYKALTSFTYNKASEKEYSWELPKAPGKISQPKGIQEKEGLQESDENFGTCNVEASNKIQQEISTTSSNEVTEPFNREEKFQSSGGDLIKLLSDKHKYTNMWHLIYQQYASSDVPVTGTEQTDSVNEKEAWDVNSYRKGMELDQEESTGNKNLNDSEDNQGGAIEIPDFDQSAALKLVQEGLTAILERDAEAIDQQCKSGEEMTNSFARAYNLAPKSSTQENMPKQIKLTGYTIKPNVNPSETEMPRQQMSESYIKLRKVFVTAKIIKAMERMKRISPKQPRYLPLEPTSEGEKVYLRHLSRNERTNTEEWMLDHALRWAISRLGPDQQRRVAQLVEAFETVTPQQIEGIRHYPIKGKTTAINTLATLDNEEPQQTMCIPDEQVIIQQDNEGLLSHDSNPEEIRLREAHEDQSRAIDLSLGSSGTQIIDEGTVKEPMSIPEDLSQSPTGDSEVGHAGEMNMMLFNKQKYTCMWNLIYQQVASSEASIDGEYGVNAIDEEENEGEAAKCKEINGPESNRSSYNTIPKQNADNQNVAGEMNESDQSAAVKLVKEALDAILQRYELPGEQQAVSVHQKIASYTDKSLEEDGKLVEKQANPAGEEKFHLSENTTVSQQHKVESNELNRPPRKMSKSYNRLKKAFVTAKFINAIQRLRINSPRKTQSLPTEAGLNNEKVYLRHLSIDGRKNYEECMLDFALRQVISRMAPEQQRRVARLVEAFETVTPQQQEKGLKYYPSEIETATVASSEQMHQTSISEERDYEILENQDDGVIPSTKGASHERSLQEDHDCKASAEGHITQQKTVEAAVSESITELSEISSISIPADIAAEVSSFGVEETTKDAEASSCFTTEGSDAKSEGDIASVLSDKQKYKSMWHLIHQQVISSEASKVPKPEFSEIDEDEGQEKSYQDSTQISCKEKFQKDKDSQSTVLNQSAAIKLVKEAIDAILQSHEQRLDQKPLKLNDMTCDNAEGRDISASAPTQENSQDNLHEKDNTSVAVQEQAEEYAAQKKMPNSNSKLKKLFVTAKFIAAMERLRKVNWRQPRHIPPQTTSVDERVYLRHLSIDGRKNHEEWMLDYALRNVISGLAPDQQRKVALLVEAFETVAPEKKVIDFDYHPKEECYPAIKSEPIEDENESVGSEDSSIVDDHCPHMQDDRFSSFKCDLLERNEQEDYQPNISSSQTELSTETPDSDQINLKIDHQTDTKDCQMQDPLVVKKEKDVIISRTLQHASLSENRQQDCEHNIGKSLFSDKQKTNSMWHLICQHLQSGSASEGESKLVERSSSINHVKRDDTSFEMMTNADYDDNDSDASSVTSELTENDAIKLVKETIDDILEGPQEMDNELVSSLRTSGLDRDQIAGQKLEKSLSRGYSKLRQLIICNKFIKTMQKLRKSHPHKQNTPAIYSGSEARKARLKSNGAGDKKGTDEWMLDNVLQKVISGLAPAKQRRVALLVQAFENVNPDQEERGKALLNLKKEPADDIPLEGNGKENGDTVFKSQHSSESLVSLNLELDLLDTASNKKPAIDRVPQDIYEDRNPTLRKEHALNGEEMKGETPFKLTDLPSVAISTSSYSCKDPADSFGDEQGFPANENKTFEKQLVEHCDQTTKESKKTVLPKSLNGTSLDKENNTSMWGLILQHVKTDIPEKVEMQSSTEREVHTEGNSENSSQFPFEGIHDKVADISTPTRFELNESAQASKAPKKAYMPNDLKDEGSHSARKSTSLDKINNTSLWGLILQHVKTEIPEKEEMQLSEETDTERNSENSSPKGIHDKEADVPTPTRFQSYESEAIKLVQEAVNELLTLPEQESDNRSMSSSKTSEQAVPHQVQENGKETASPIAAQTEAVVDVTAASENEKAPAKESLPSTNNKLSRIIMCKRFIKAMSEMRQLKIQPQEKSCSTQTESKENPSLRQTVSGEKKSWEEGMLDHALQQVVGKLAPAQKKRVALLVRAFETVGSQQESTVGQRA